VSGAFSSLEWSPDGRWLLLAWPAADQWLFVSPARVLPVSGIARAFAGGAGPAAFPSLGGWCCYLVMCQRSAISGLTPGVASTSSGSIAIEVPNTLKRYLPGERARTAARSR